MSGTYSASEYHFQEVVLTIPERGIELDIGPTIIELMLYESVNTPYITGSMVCVDTQYVFDRLRFDGTERVTINIASDYDEVLTKSFFITRTTGKTKVDENTYAYNYYIAEDIFFLDVLKSVSRAYNGTPDEIIKNVLSNEFKRELSLIGKAPYQSAFNYVSPFISPLAIIDTIRRRAYDINGFPYFVYASLKEEEIRMKSLSEMIENEPINKTSFVFSNAQNFKLDPVQQLINVESFVEDNTNDTIELLIKGAVQNQYNVLNLSTNKRNQQNRFNITEALEAGANKSIFNKDFTIEDKGLNEFDPNVVYKIVNHTTMDELGYHDERDIEQHLNKVKSSALVSALSKKKITIGTTGVYNFYRDTVFIGEQINLMLPQFESETKDTVTSGSYVVLETKHVFSENKYNMFMTCSRLTQSSDETTAIGPNK
jgi:uncharacterized membrane protein